jgi:cytochrome c556
MVGRQRFMHNAQTIAGDGMSSAPERFQGRGIVRVTAFAAGLLLAASGVVVGAQAGAKVSTPEELDKVMKKTQQSMQAAQKSMRSGDYAGATTQLAAVREAVEESQTFWVVHKKDDAVKMNKDVLAKLDALMPIVSAATVDGGQADAALKEVGAACRSCHQEYRQRDADNNFILKPGSIGG